MTLRESPIGGLVSKCSTWNPASQGCGSFDYIDLSSIDKDSKSITEVVRYLCSEAPSRARQLVEEGDILVATVRPNLNGVALVGGEHSGMTASTGYCVLRPIQNKLDSNYLFHWVKTGVFVQRMIDVATGASYPAVSDAKVKASTIPLPPLAEQKRIAAILDAADALRAKRRESLAQLDTLLQATFLDMFGDCSEGVTIGELLAKGILLLHKDGNHGSLYPRANEFGESGIPFLSAKCISEDGDLLYGDVQYLSEGKARKLKIGWIENGDVLLAHNASVGKTCLYRGEYEEALIGTSLTAFRPNPEALDSGFLLGALRSQGFQQQLISNMGQTTRNQVPITAQRRLTIPIPPIDLQQRFATIVESVEQQKARLRDHLAELDVLFASLQQRAFTGDL